MIELLVVIAIIAILASLLLPALGKARTKANIVVCSSQLRQTGMSIQMYTNDYASHFPPYKTGGNQSTNHLRGRWGYGLMGLGLVEDGDYTENTDLFYCPGREEHGINIGGGRNACDYAINWVPMNPLGVYSPTVRKVSNEYNRNDKFQPGGRRIKYVGLRAIVADVRTYGGWRETPSDIPHDGTGNVLLIDGSVQSLRDAFGPNIPLQHWASNGPLQGDRNYKPYHDKGRAWWTWAEAKIRGESVGP